MPFHELKQRPDLVGLGLPVHVLKVHEFGHGRMDEDMVATADPGETKTERLCEGARFSEPDVVRRTKCSLEELRGIHPGILPRGSEMATSGCVARRWRKQPLLRLTKRSSAASASESAATPR